MPLFSKPPPKKPDPLKQLPKSSGQRSVRRIPRRMERPVSAREVAFEAQGRKGETKGSGAEPAGEITVTGASLIQWSPSTSAIEVAQQNPGLCTVLENAALLYAGGQKEPARNLLEQAVQSDTPATIPPLASLPPLHSLHPR